MARDFAEYISSICHGVRVDSRTREEISKEIEAHLRDHAEGLKSRGCGEDEASRQAIESLGNPRDLARDLLMVHAQGTWRDAFLTSLPHLLVALLLTAYYAQSVLCLIAVLLVSGLGISQAVTRRAPPWSFSWLGYCMVPVVLIIFILLGATHWWTLLGIAYIPCAVLVVVYVVRETVSRDSLYVSLMLSPWAIITTWFMAAHGLCDVRNTHLNSSSMMLYSRELVGSFVALAIASFVFARLRSRWAKAIALIVPLTGVFGYIALYCWDGMSLAGWMVSTAVLLVVGLPTVREFVR